MKIPEDMNKFIGSKIREAREAAKKSQMELANALGFESATAISLIESGERKVRVEDLEKIARFLDKDIKFFIGQENKAVDVRVALRADKDLSEKDREAILRFIEVAKQNKKDGN